MGVQPDDIGAGRPGSTLELYRAAIARRPRGGRLVWRESPSGTLVFERGEMICAVNVDAPELSLPDGELVLASDPGVATTLPPNTSAWIRRTT
jgi:alpha-glucosidase